MKDKFEKVRDNMSRIDKFSGYLLILVLFVQVLVGTTMVRYFEIVALIYWGIYMRLSGIAIILYCMVVKKFSIKEISFYGFGLGLWLIIGFQNVFRYDILNLIAIIMLAKDEDYDWLIARLLKIFSLSIGLTIILSWLEVIPTRLVERPDGFVRNSLGFWHPNTTAAILLATIMIYLLKVKKHFNILKTVGIILFYLIINIFTDSRTSLILMLLLVLGYFISGIFKKISQRILSYVAKNFFILMLLFLILSYGISYLYTGDNSFLRILDSWSSYRIILGRGFILDYPLNLFGNQLTIFSPNDIGANTIETGFRVLDNGYLHILLSQGIIFTILMLYYFSWIIKKMFNLGFYIVPLLGIVLALFGLMEQTFMSFPFNVLVIFGGILLKNSNLGE